MWAALFMLESKLLRLWKAFLTHKDKTGTSSRKIEYIWICKPLFVGSFSDFRWPGWPFYRSLIDFIRVGWSGWFAGVELTEVEKVKYCRSWLRSGFLWAPSVQQPVIEAIHRDVIKPAWIHWVSLAFMLTNYLNLCCKMEVKNFVYQKPHSLPAF